MEKLILIPIFFPIIAGILVKILNLQNRKPRQIYVSLVVIINAIILFSILKMGDISLELFRINQILSIRFRSDNMATFFTVLASVLWIISSFYSFEYMKHEEREIRYFTFLLMTLGVIIGLGFAANMFTFYLFYEFMTLITFPLVIHSMSKESIKAGKKYLIYSFFGAALVLVGIIFVYNYGQSFDFVPGGILDFEKIGSKENLLLTIYLLSFIGFGSKAGMFPLHDWLPTAHPVAPAPASGLLSGIITKAGVLGIIRMTYFVFGPDFIKGTWVHNTILILIIFTIFMGSMMAYKSKLLKERLAYSSVSQVSYVLFGIMLLNLQGFQGGLLHMVFHALIKNILFLSVGVIMYKTNITRVDEIKGIGKSMPITMWCFTLGSLALVGIPPLSGFISKWYLAMGGLDLGNSLLGLIGVIILLISALLTGGYLIPIFRDAFFPGDDFDYTKVKKLEPNGFMIIPLIILTIGAVIFGIFPNNLLEFINTISSEIFTRW